MTIANKLQYKVQNDFKHDCLLAMDLYQGESIAIVAATIVIAVNSGHISAVFLEEGNNGSISI